MIFNTHSDLVGQHALFSPSQSAWLRYDKKKITERVLSQYRAPLGTEIHEFAATQIELSNKVSSIKSLRQNIATYISTKYKLLELDQSFSEKLIEMLHYITPDVMDTVKAYINDAIGFQMTPEQVLYFSDEIFGTTDAICFRDNNLRIHDLKTGVTPAHMEQLAVYASLFCLEYKVKPKTINIELRLYQSGEVIIDNPTTEDMEAVIEQVIRVGSMATKVKGRRQ